MGHLSGRARILRLGVSFLRTFSKLISKTDLVSTDEEKFIMARRRSVENPQVEFVYYRNFYPEKTSFASSDGVPVFIPYKQSFIGVENYNINHSIKLLSSKVPIVVRTRLLINQKSTEVWIVQNNYHLGAGNLVFEGEFDIENYPDISMSNSQTKNRTIISLPSADQAWFSLKSTGSKSPDLYVVCLSLDILYTLEPNFQEPYWNSLDPMNSEYPTVVTWGAYGAHYDRTQNSIILEHSLLESGKELFVIVSEDKLMNGLCRAEAPFSGLPFVYSKPLPKEGLSKIVQDYKFPLLDNWEFSVHDFEQIPYEKIPMKSQTRPAKNTIDYCYTSGHVIYKLTFGVSDPSNDLTLSINMRHRGTFYLNNSFLSTHLVYNLGIFRAGSKNGPDNTYGGWQNIILPKAFLKQGSNSLIILIESFGLNRQPFCFNDIRCPRGIIEASIRGVTIIDWEIAGVDVRQTDQTYNISGLPLESEFIKKTALFNNWTCNAEGVKLDISGIQGPAWFKSMFHFPSLLQKDVRAPVRLVLSGPATCYVAINEIIIARYYGNGDGPQTDFYVPEGLLSPSENKITILAYRTSDGDSWINLRFDYWRMSETDHWSGNLGSGVPLVLVSSEINLADDLS